MEMHSLSLTGLPGADCCCLVTQSIVVVLRERPRLLGWGLIAILSRNTTARRFRVANAQHDRKKSLNMTLGLFYGASILWLRSGVLLKAFAGSAEFSK